MQEWTTIDISQGFLTDVQGKQYVSIPKEQFNEACVNRGGNGFEVFILIVIIIFAFAVGRFTASN